MTTLTATELDEFRGELDALRARIASKVGSDDAEHVRAVRALSQTLEVAGRVLIHVSLEPVSFTLGVLGLGLSKILENMEVGHNVLHGQYDFMGDPTLDSRTYEWGMVGTAKTWKRAHNVSHHTYTNVIGKDDDFGYTAFRFSGDVAWNPIHVLQPIISPMSGLFFDHSIALYDLRLTHYLLPKALRNKELGASRPPAEVRDDLTSFAKKAGRSYLKEYVFYPALAGPFAPKVALGNVLAHGVRNVWAYAVIYCGHLTESVRTFDESELATETKGGFYLRQILGSSNFTAGPILGILSGHLSHQIEHHLFPDLPAWRYREMGPEVARICAKYGVPYNTASFGEQLRSVAREMFRFAKPGGAKKKLLRTPLAETGAAKDKGTTPSTLAPKSGRAKGGARREAGAISPLAAAG